MLLLASCLVGLLDSGRSSWGDQMAHRLIKRDLQTTEDLHFPHDRRSGIERRSLSYVVHALERRSGTDRRDSDERRKDWIRTSQWTSAWRELYEPDWVLAD
jgi:hypothetical protein